MKVFAISSTEEILGGGEISFALSLKLLQESGWEVLTLVPAEGPYARYLRERGIPVVTSPQESLRRDFAWRYLVRPEPEWLRIIDEYRPDLIHCNAVRGALYAQAVGRALGIPTILHARKSEKLAAIDPLLLWRLDTIICISEVVRRRFPGWFGRRKLRLLYNPVDFAEFASVPARTGILRDRWSAGKSNFLVGTLGRLSPIKGQHLVVEAAPYVLSRLPCTRFVFVGSEDPTSPGYVRTLQDRIRTLGLAENFVFAEQELDIVSVYHALDLILFPSSSEGFGRIIIEAGAARKALVASDIEVIREVLSENLVDLMFPYGQVDALARRIVELLENDELRRATADRLYRHVLNHFNLEAHRTGLLKIYEDFISKKI